MGINYCNDTTCTLYVTEYIELLNHGLFQRPDNHGTGRTGIPPELRVTTLLLWERSCRGSQVLGSQIHQRISCRLIEYITYRILWNHYII